MLLTWFQKTKSVKPYSQLAYIYDFVMRHVNYRNWAEYLCRLFQKARIPVNDVLDISCGTGSLLFQLQDLQYGVVGMDASIDMLNVARSKAVQRGRSLPLWLGSMTDFSVKKPFQVVVCTYDSINYCLESDAIAATMESVARALCPGGLFIFDVCTLKNSRRNFQRYYENDDTESFHYSRISYFQKEQRMQVNKFLIKWYKEGDVAFTEMHRQKIYTLDEIRNFVPAALFRIEGAYDGFSLRPGSENSNRVHFVLQKV